MRPVRGRLAAALVCAALGAWQAVPAVERTSVHMRMQAHAPVEPSAPAAPAAQSAQSALGLRAVPATPVASAGPVLSVAPVAPLRDAARAGPAPATPWSVAQRVAPGVWTVRGAAGGVDARNRGAIGNSGFIATPAGTVVVNTGGSYRLGRELLALAERTTGQAAILGVITQARPEFVMGNAAFADRGIALLAHEATARAIAQRCQVCLDLLREQLGDDLMAGTRIVVPARTVAATTRLAPGGRAIELLHLGAGQTPGDLVVVDVQTGVAFAGALVTDGRIPELDVGGVAAPWRRVLAAMATQRWTTLVPGYGAPGASASLIAATDRYLAGLEARVQALLDQGAPLHGAERVVKMVEWRRWARYDALHARNVQRQFVGAEQLWLQEPVPGGAR